MPSTAVPPARDPATARPAWNNRSFVQPPAQRPVDPRNPSAYARSRYATTRPQQPANQPAPRQTTAARRPIVIQSTPTGSTARGTGSSPATSQSRASQIFGASNSADIRPSTPTGNASRGNSAGRSRR
jgi:hypothetical protein